ncbi:hypothetical protein AOQ84DRAFT_414375 [Glonium stellatum]|uniref:Uncharacterized protein n=1 Tax=Glonium stellatum TaxID=574774 RepID=A0A8E2EUT9_9PEZI|nr:hypothetical protein AOQ84DRAFT_414375 [Glonium stellatum]
MPALCLPVLVWPRPSNKHCQSDTPAVLPSQAIVHSSMPLSRPAEKGESRVRRWNRHSAGGFSAQQGAADRDRIILVTIIIAIINRAVQGKSPSERARGYQVLGILYLAEDLAEEPNRLLVPAAYLICSNE